MQRSILTGICILILMMLSAGTAWAATLSLSPASTSVPIDTTFSVKLLIDTEGESTTSTDAVMLFDNSILSVVSVEEGENGSNPFYPDMFPNVSPGEIYIGASVIESIDTRSGTGTIATITFKGIAEGTSDVQFDCTPGKTSDTNISKSDKNQTDIVNCASLIDGRYTIGSGIVATSTPHPSGVPTIYYTPTPRPTMPTSGTMEITFGIVATGMLLLVGGVGSRILLKT